MGGCPRSSRNPLQDPSSQTLPPFSDPTKLLPGAPLYWDTDHKGLVTCLSVSDGQDCGFYIMASEVCSLAGRKEGKGSQAVEQQVADRQWGRRRQGGCRPCCRQTEFTPSTSPQSSHPTLDAAAAPEVTSSLHWKFSSLLDWMFRIWSASESLNHPDGFRHTLPGHPGERVSLNCKAETTEEEGMGGQDEN